MNAQRTFSSSVSTCSAFESWKILWILSQWPSTHILLYFHPEKNLFLETYQKNCDFLHNVFAVLKHSSSFFCKISSFTINFALITAAWKGWRARWCGRTTKASTRHESTVEIARLMAAVTHCSSVAESWNNVDLNEKPLKDLQIKWISLRLSRRSGLVILSSLNHRLFAEASHSRWSWISFHTFHWNRRRSFRTGLPIFLIGFHGTA